MKHIRFFYLKIFRFLVVKFSIYLNRRVFVMFGQLVKNRLKCYFVVLFRPLHEKTCFAYSRSLTRVYTVHL